jgi:membrane-associated phospholipid phosphatase
MVNGLRTSDWVALVYFLYLAGVCWLRPLTLRKRLVVSGVSLVTAAIVVGASRARPIVHDWAPMLYLTVGYYLTGWLYVGPSLGLETWLREWDRKLLGDPTRRFARWPAWLVAYLNVVYTFCFLLLPAGFAVLLAGGHADFADHYWTMVLAADLGAFAPLSVFQTRPPWRLEPPAQLPGRAAHELASTMVRHATIGVNTFPSGHVAVSFAVAIAVAAAMPIAGTVLLVIAASITVACVVGRYHYAMDAVTGLLLAAFVWGAVSMLGT